MNKRVALILSLAFVSTFGKTGLGPGDQDWGYVDVRNGAHMFYWLYRTTANVDFKTRPLVLWLQGGPGASSSGTGNFEELGILDTDLNIRNSSWVTEVNVVFVDNPVGTGFSYVDSSSLLTTKNSQIAEDLVAFTTGFLENHPEFKEIPFYIFCESYGGKMAAEYALALDNAIKSGTVQADFKGVALGDSWISPIDSVLTWAPFLLSTGVVDQQGFSTIDKSAQDTKTALNNGDFIGATDLWSETEGLVESVSGGVDFYNILTKTSASRRLGKSSNKKEDLLRRHGIIARADLGALMNGRVKEVLQIPSDVVWGSQGGYVFDALYEDFMKPVVNIVERLLSETDLKVVVFSGQLDLIVDTPGTVNWVDKLQWSGADCFRQASRSPLAVNGILEGYVKTCKNFNFYWIDRSGHMVPIDNPGAGLKLVKDVTGY